MFGTDMLEPVAAARPDGSAPLGTPGEEDDRRTKLTVTLPADLVERLRNTVVALSGPPHRLTLAAVVRQALETELLRLRDQRSGRARGRQFPQRSEGLRPGRPISGLGASNGDQ